MEETSRRTELQNNTELIHVTYTFGNVVSISRIETQINKPGQGREPYRLGRKVMSDE